MRHKSRSTSLCVSIPPAGSRTGETRVQYAAFLSPAHLKSLQRVPLRGGVHHLLHKLRKSVLWMRGKQSERLGGTGITASMRGWGTHQAWVCLRISCHSTRRNTSTARWTNHAREEPQSAVTSGRHRLSKTRNDYHRRLAFGEALYRVACTCGLQVHTRTRSPPPPYIPALPKRRRRGEKNLTINGADISCARWTFCGQLAFSRVR